jgi:hypothetical protein
MSKSARDLLMANAKSRADAAKPGDERRRHPRTATTFSAELRAGRQRYATRVINLSMGGALLDFSELPSKPRIAVGARVAVEIRSRPLQQTFTAEGRAVLWNTTRGPEPLLAIQFDELTGDSAEALEELLALASIDAARFKSS